MLTLNAPQIQSQPVPLPAPIAALPAIHLRAFAALRSSLVLDCCKWDPQVGDVSALAPFPLVISGATWRWLARTAELLTAELRAAEEELIRRPDLHCLLAISRPLRRALRAAAENQRPPAAARMIRFDFHYSTDGWRISEANSDVPGGLTEASHFTEKMADYFPGFATCGNPLQEWIAALRDGMPGNAPIGLLSAPGYMEDLQIMAGLEAQLRQCGRAACLCRPSQLSWRDGRVFLAGSNIQLGGILRFLQAEWLPALPRHVQWRHFFYGSRTPVANPATAILTESKCFPLVWDRLSTRLPTWRRLLPETRDPRDVPWRRDATWLLKSAFCNTGDTVAMRELLSAKAWRSAAWAVRWNPRGWIAQQRFQTVPIPTPDGPIYPCIGVYTINGHACGIYARIGDNPVVTYAARDVAVLVAPESFDFNSTGAA